MIIVSLRLGRKGIISPTPGLSRLFQLFLDLRQRLLGGGKELGRLLLAEEDIDVVVSIHMPIWKLDKETIKKFTFYWATLMTGADSLFELNKILAKNPEPNSREIFFAYSQDWLDTAKEYLRRFHPKHADFFDKNVKCKIIGNPEFDVFKSIDKDKVRQKYKIPKDKSIVLYLPFPYDNRAVNSAWERAFCGLLINTAQSKDGAYLHDKKKTLLANLQEKAYCLYQIAKDPSARRYWLGGMNEAKVFNAIRKFADKNNFYLVSKPRVKFPASEIVKEKSDLIIWDTEKQQDPPILKELVSIAKLTISFLSSSVLTSLAGGVSHLNIELPDVFFVNSRHEFLFSSDCGSQFNFAGVCQSLSIEEVIDNFKNYSIDDFSVDEQKYRQYLDKYIGFGDCNSSERLFDELGELVGQYERKI